MTTHIIIHKDRVAGDYIENAIYKSEKDLISTLNLIKLDYKDILHITEFMDMWNDTDDDCNGLRDYINDYFITYVQVKL